MNKEEKEAFLHLEKASEFTFEKQHAINSLPQTNFKAKILRLLIMMLLQHSS